MFLRLLLVSLALTLAGSGRANLVAQKKPGVRPPQGDELALLTTALERTASDMGRWAYTERRLVRDEKGKVKTDTVVRYDPSRPYGEQWTPLSINGKPPSAADREKYRKQGERAGRNEARGQPSRQYSLGELLEVSRASVAGETDRQLVFEIPLRAERNNRFPPEKFEVLARVDREPGVLGDIAVRLREGFRSRVVVKVKSGDGTLEFSTVHPEHPPTLTSIRGDASASILFVSVGGELELTRTDFKRVRPYSERFEVQIGTLKAIDF